MSNEVTSKKVASDAGWILSEGKADAELAIKYLEKHTDSMLFNNHLRTLKNFINKSVSVAGSALTQTEDKNAG